MRYMSQFVSRIEFIRSKLSNFSAHVSGVRVTNAASSVGGAAAARIDHPLADVFYHRKALRAWLTLSR